MSIKRTKDLDLNLDNIPIGKALVFKQEDNTYIANCLYWEDAKGRILKPIQNKGITNAILPERFSAETESEVIEKIEKWAKEKYGEKVILKEIS